MNFFEKVTTMDFNAILTILAVWFVCAVLNTIWLKHNPNVIAVEFNSALITLAPLATFFIAIGFGYRGFVWAVKAAAGKIEKL